MKRVQIGGSIEMYVYRILAAYNGDVLHEGNYRELTEKTGLCATTLRRYCDKARRAKGWRIITAYDVKTQLLDTETGEVIAEGTGNGISRQLNANLSYVANIRRRPSSMYSARVVQIPTSQFLEIARAYGHDV